MFTIFACRHRPSTLSEAAVPEAVLACPFARTTRSTRLSRWAQLSRHVAGLWPAGGRGAEVGAARPDLEPAVVPPLADPGLPVANVASLVAAQAPVRARVRAAVGDDALFERLHVPALDAVTRHVHLLPASARAHFAGAGGLLRLSLECAMFCAEAAAGRLAGVAVGVQQRHALASRWRHAAFLAGLACELPRTLAGVAVCDPQGREWPKYDCTLDAWIDAGRVRRYHVNWLAPDGAARIGRAQATSLLAQVFPAASLAWLESGSPTIVRDLYAVSLGDSQACGSPLADLVDAVRREVLRHDAARRPAPGASARVGYPLEWHLLDALRARFERGDWVPGAVGEGMSWWQAGALCLRWPDAGRALVADLLERGLQGVPRASLTLVDCLAAAKLLVADEHGSWIWPVVAATRPAGPSGAAMRAEPARAAALRFADPAALLPAFHPRGG